MPPVIMFHMRKRTGSLLLFAALGAANVLAFDPPKDAKEGLEVVVEGFDENLSHPFLGIREVPPDEPLSFTVAVRSTRTSPTEGTLSVWLNDDWTLEPSAPVRLSLAPGRTERRTFVARSKPIDRQGYWCYPIHARFTTASDDLHAIAIFKPEGGTGPAPKPPEIPVPAFGAPPINARTYDLKLTDGYVASVTPGEKGLQDGSLAFTTDGKTFVLRGFEINIDRREAEIVSVEVRSDEKGLDVLHHVRRTDGRPLVARARIRTLRRALAVAWDMPGAVRDNAGHPRYTRLSVGPGSSAVFRAYLGFGNVIERPGDFRLPAISNTLSGRHAGADYDCGLSLVQAVKVSPDFLRHAQKDSRLTLEANGDNVFYFVPSKDGAFEAAHAFAAVSGYRRSAGWESIAGKTCLDQQSGDYDATAEGLRQLARYGVNDAFFMRHLWQRWGFDYRFPEICPAAGDTNAFNRMVGAAKAAGMRFVPHTNYTDFYPDAEGFSYDKIQFREDGRPASGWFSAATRALSYFWLPSAIHAPLAKNQRLMKEQFDPGGVFIDVFTTVVPNDYFDRAGRYHARDEMTAEWAKACDFARATVGDGRGPVVSEGGTDHLVGHVDASHTDHFSADRWEVGGFADAERVPWQDMVTHGKMLMLGGGFEQRYAATKTDKALDMRLHGYGSDDYLTTTVMGGRSPMTEMFSARTVKTHWTVHDVCAVLARETFEAHAFVGNVHRQRMTFSRGGSVEINRGTNDWTVGGRILPPYGFYARADGVEAGVVRLDGQRAGFSRTKDAFFCDARPPLGDDGSKLAHVEVVAAKYVADGAFDVTYRITLNLDGLERFKPFLMFQKAVNGKPSAHEVYACHGALAIPEGKMKRRGTFDITGRHTLPARLEAGEYTLHFGFFEPKSAARMDIAGPGVFNGRIWGGTFSIAKEKDRVVSGSWSPAETREEGNPLELNLGRKLLDFGGVRTDGAIRIVRRGQSLEVIPMPGSPSFRAEIDPRVFGLNGDVIRLNADGTRFSYSISNL